MSALDAPLVLRRAYPARKAFLVMTHEQEVAAWRATLDLQSALDRWEKADSDDHYYGAWIGGSAASGGHPKGERAKTKPTSTVEFIRTWEDKIYTMRGAERTICLDAEGGLILDKSEKGYAVHYTDAELASMKGGIFTHNHPRGWDVPEWDPRRAGNSFSVDDMVVASTVGLAEIHAVTPTTRYTMKPGKVGGWGSVLSIMTEHAGIDRRVRREFQARIDAGDPKWGTTLAERQAHAEAEHTQLVMSRLAASMGWAYSEVPR